MNEEQRTVKRKRVVLSLQQKKEIFTFSRDNPGISQAFIADLFSAKWSKDISRRTVGDILNNKGFEGPGELPEKEKYFSKARHADLENLLFEWVLSAKAQNVAITEEKLITTAKIIGEQLMISDFSYSAGWLAKFKRRFSINSKRDSELPNDNSTEIDDLVMLRNQNLAAESEGNEFIASFVTHQPMSEPHESMIDMKDINEIIEAATAEESDVEEKQETKRAKISPQEALDSIKTLVSYMESSQDFAPEEVCTLFRIENKIRLKSQSTS